MKRKIKELYILLLTIVLSLSFGYGACYLKNKDSIESNNYDVNKDGEVDILDLLQLQKYITENKQDISNSGLHNC